MAESSKSYRPIIAVLLGSALTGLGHLYLRRWLRASAWIGIAAVVSVLFVPDAATAAVLAGEPMEPLSILPVLAVGALSALDAYNIALHSNTSSKKTTETAVTGDSAVECPGCGKPFDPELGFYHWCTTEM